MIVIFVIVIVEGAVQLLSVSEQESFKDSGLATILYADDTLLVGTSQSQLQGLLDAVATVGARFGLELHWDKLQLVQVGCSYSLQKRYSVLSSPPVPWGSDTG